MKRKKVEESFPEYIQIPYQLMMDKSITPLDRFVYGAVHYYSKMNNKKCYASNITIAKMIGSTPKTVGHSLQKLEDRGYILRDYADKINKKDRTEIVPLISKSKRTTTPLTKGVPTPLDKRLTEKNRRLSDTLQTSIQTPGKKSKKSLFLDKISQKTIENTEESFLEDSEIRRLDRRVIESSIESTTKVVDHKEFLAPPSGDTRLVDKIDGNFVDQVNKMARYNSEDEIPHQLACEVISYFLPIFPDAFISRNPFAIKSNVNAVKKLLMRLTPEEIKMVIDKYHASKTDRFLPVAPSIYSFCVYKWASIEAYIQKSAGGLWGQRSISTPEQSKTRDLQYMSVIEKGREKNRLAKEQWEKDHPNQNQK